MIRIKTGALVVLCALAASSAQAVGLDKGSSILAFQLTNGIADLEQMGPPGYVSGTQVGDVGVQAEFSHFVKSDYAFTLAAGTTLSKMTLSSSTAGAPDLSQKITGFHVRVGGDYAAHLTDRLHLFAGPGLEWKSSKGKQENGTTTVEGNGSTRIGASGRISMHMRLSSHVGIKGDVGRHFGYASVTNDAGAKASWWSGGNFGSGGLAFDF